MDDAVLQFRLARPDDDAEVQSIFPNGFNGMDYMPTKFQRFLSHSLCRVFVCELNGSVVAMTVAHVCNAGRDLLFKGGRVRPAYQGKGIYGKLKKFATIEMKCIFPRIQNELHTTESTNQHAQTHSYQKRYKYLFERFAVMWETSDPYGTGRCVQDPNVLSVVDVTDGGNSTKENKDFMANSYVEVLQQILEKSCSVLPERVVICWVPYDPRDLIDGSVLEDDICILASYKHVKDSSIARQVFMYHRYLFENQMSRADESTIDDHLETKSHTYSARTGISDNSDKDILSLSFGCKFIGKFGLIYHVDLYGEEINELLEHTRFHLKKAVHGITTERLAFVTYIPRNVDTSIFQEKCKQLGLMPRPDHRLTQSVVRHEFSDYNDT